MEKLRAVHTNFEREELVLQCVARKGAFEVPRAKRAGAGPRTLSCAQLGVLASLFTLDSFKKGALIALHALLSDKEEFSALLEEQLRFGSDREQVRREALHKQRKAWLEEN
jgi:hypothetical protein